MKNLDPHEQLDLLLFTLENGKHNDIISLTKELKHCYKTYESFINTKDINVFHNEKLIDLIIDRLVKDEKSIIPSLLNLVIIICRNDDNNILIGKKKGIEIIFQIMEFHFDNIAIQENACLALWANSTNTNNGRLIKNKGGIERVTKIMKLNPNHINIQKYSCGILANIVYIEDDEETLIKFGEHIELVIKAMKIHFDNADIQRVACSALANIARIDQNKRLIKNKGGIKLILRAMELHFDDGEVQKATCVVLSNLMATNDDNVLLIEQKRGIELIFRAMKLHSNCDYIQDHIIKALRRFAMNEKNRELINKLGFEF